LLHKYIHTHSATLQYVRPQPAPHNCLITISSFFNLWLTPLSQGNIEHTVVLMKHPTLPHQSSVNVRLVFWNQHDSNMWPVSVLSPVYQLVNTEISSTLILQKQLNICFVLYLDLFLFLHTHTHTHARTNIHMHMPAHTTCICLQIPHAISLRSHAEGY